MLAQALRNTRTHRHKKHTLIFSLTRGYHIHTLPCAHTEDAVLRMVLDDIYAHMEASDTRAQKAHMLRQARLYLSLIHI